MMKPLFAERSERDRQFEIYVGGMQGQLPVVPLLSEA